MKFTLSLFSLLICSSFHLSAGLKPIVLNPDYDHNKWGTAPSDHIFEFAAYTSSFDTGDDNDADGDGDIWGIPEWVAFEIKGNQEREHLKTRPSSWATADELFEQGLAPKDSTYAVSGTIDLKAVKSDYRFIRGHMCPKITAERVSADAAYNTHTTVNAVPQLQWQNNGIWKSLEKQCVDWADEFAQVWVICGPVFFGKNPSLWLGQEEEIRAAVPDALYKIVIREDEGGGVKTISFIIPNILPKVKKDYMEYLASIDEIEDFTGLDFLTLLDEEAQALVEEIDDSSSW